MIDIPEDLSADTLDSLFVRGSLFHCENHDFDSGEKRNKFILVMSDRSRQARSYFYLPTSKVEKYLANRVYAPALYIFPEQKVATFSKPTGVIVHKVHSKPFSYFVNRYSSTASNGKLTFCEKLPDSVMIDIYKMIVSSTRISFSVKKQILPAEYFA